MTTQAIIDGLAAAEQGSIRAAEAVRDAEAKVKEARKELALVMAQVGAAVAILKSLNEQESTP